MSGAQKPETVWRLELDTRHFSFVAHAKTESGCRAAMRAALKEHARICKLPDKWVVEQMTDSRPEEWKMGAGYRDGEQITDAAP